jgi:hypothetical protein
MNIKSIFKSFSSIFFFLVFCCIPFFCYTMEQSSTFLRDLKGKKIHIIYFFKQDELPDDIASKLGTILEKYYYPQQGALVSATQSTQQLISYAIFQITAASKIEDTIIGIRNNINKYKDTHQIIFVSGISLGKNVSQILSSLGKDSLYSVILFDPDVYEGTSTLFSFNLDCIQHRLYNFYSKTRTYFGLPLLYRKIKSNFNLQNAWLQAVNVLCFELTKNQYLKLNFTKFDPDLFLNAIDFIDKNYKLNIDLTAIFGKKQDFPNLFKQPIPIVFINREITYQPLFKRLKHEYANPLTFIKKTYYVWNYEIPNIDDIYIQNILAKETKLSLNEISSLPARGLDVVIEKKQIVKPEQIQIDPEIKNLIDSLCSIIDFAYKNQSKYNSLISWFGGQLSMINLTMVSNYFKDLIQKQIQDRFTSEIKANVILDSLADKIKENKGIIEKFQYDIRTAITGLKANIYSANPRDTVIMILNWINENPDYIPYFVAYRYFYEKNIEDFLMLLSDNNTILSFISELKPKNTVAKVRRGKTISDAENKILSTRKKEIIIPALNKICSSQDVFIPKIENEKDAPGIGIVCSGGGYQSMIATLGFIHGLESTGLLDTASYMSTLSGSSWMLFSWLAYRYSTNEKNDFKHFSNFLRENAQYFGKAMTEEEIKNIASILLIKIRNGQTVTLVDFYGALLARAFLREFPNSGQTFSLSKLSNLDLSHYPFPIANAVGSTYEQFLGFEITSKNAEQNYFWFEFSPLEIGCEYLESWINPEFSGCLLDNGKLTQVGPEASLGSFMGIWGSAFTTDINTLLQKDTDKMNPLLYSLLNNFLFKQGDNWIKFTQKESYPLGIEPKDIKEYELSSSNIINPAYNLQDLPGLSTKKELTLFDGGVDFNLPVDCMIRRNINLYLICDASANISPEKNQLNNFINYAKNKGYQLPKIDLKNINKDDISIFYDVQRVFIPVIVYIPVISGLSSLKFIYDEQLFNSTYSVMKKTIEYYSNAIQNAIRLAILNRKIFNESDTEINQKLRLLRSQIIQKIEGGSIKKF